MTKEELEDRIARAEAIQQYTENRCATLEEENLLLGERCNQLLKDKGNLIDKTTELQHKVDTLQGFLDHDIEYDMDKAIQNLKKENAELKTNYKVLSCSVGDWEELQEKYEKEQRENNGLSDQLAQAKEIIKNIIRVTWGEGWNYSLDWKVKAEQFLKKEQ